MSDDMDLERRIAELVRRARTDGMSPDLDVRATFFEEKAAVFQLIADTQPWQAVESAEIAAKARADAAALRAEGGAA